MKMEENPELGKSNGTSAGVKISQAEVDAKVHKLIDSAEVHGPAERHVKCPKCGTDNISMGKDFICSNCDYSTFSEEGEAMGIAE